MRKISTSSKSTWQTCQRKWWNQYILGYSPVAVSENLHLGTLVHAGLEVWWATRILYDAGGAVMDKSIELKCSDAVRSKAMALVKGYIGRWGTEQQSLKTISVEQKITWPLFHPETGKRNQTTKCVAVLDGITEDENGDKWIVEHKTTGSDISPGSAYWDRLDSNDQVWMYFEAARAAGHDVVGVIYDVIGKPAIRQKKTESEKEFLARYAQVLLDEPERYYQRKKIFRTESSINEFRLDLWNTAQQITTAVNRNLITRTTSQCAEFFGGKCEFYPVCHEGASLEDETLYMIRKKG